MLLAYNRYAPALASRKYSSGPVASKGLAISLIIVFGLVGISMAYWLFLFSNNIILNYKISGLRSTVVQTKQDISSLQESMSQLVNNNTLKQWAQANNFVPVEELGYLNLANEDLAKLPRYNF